MSYDRSYGLPVDGDVQIHINTQCVLNLESRLLKRLCPNISGLIAPDMAAELSDVSITRGVTSVYRVELQLPHGSSAESIDPGFLRPVLLDDKGKPKNGADSRVIQVNPYAPTSWVIFDAWCNVFRCMYHLPLEKLDSPQPEVVFRGVVAMMQVADYLGCIQMLKAPVESALWPNQQFIQNCMSKNPVGWLATASKLRSSNLFKEALIHTVGQFNSIDTEDLNPLDEKTMAIVNRKVGDLYMKKAAVENNLTSYVPAQLTPSGTMRQDYSENIFNWQAFAIWQHWMHSQLGFDRGRHGVDGGYAFYRSIYDGAYLLNDDMKQTWFIACPLTSRAQGTLMARIDCLKERASKVVSELLESNLSLDQDAFPLAYLTCIDFDLKKDLPWLDDRGI